MDTPVNILLTNSLYIFAVTTIDNFMQLQLYVDHMQLQL